MIENTVLYLFAVLVLTGGIMAAFAPQVLYAIIGMGISLLGLSGLFLFLGSPFVAAMQLLIYIGGITVAIVFAMMLSVSMALTPLKSNGHKKMLALVSSALFFVAVAVSLHGASFPTPAQLPGPQEWSVDQLGHLLLNSYNLVFETLSVVLLLAIIGAVLIARKERAV